MNKLKLFVDDIRPAPEGWQQARTVTDAIRFLHKFEVEEISLDHDISYAVEVAGTQRPFPSPETFMAVAYYIVEKYKTRMLAKNAEATITCLSLDCPERNGDECRHGAIPKIRIHTANPVGGDYMRKLFEENGYSPIIEPSSRVNRLESEL